MTAWLLTPVGRFRLMALAEAWSWAGLLLGSLLKRVGNAPAKPAD